MRRMKRMAANTKPTETATTMSKKTVRRKQIETNIAPPRDADDARELSWISDMFHATSEAARRGGHRNERDPKARAEERQRRPSRGLVAASDAPAGCWSRFARNARTAMPRRKGDDVADAERDGSEFDRAWCSCSVGGDAGRAIDCTEHGDGERRRKWLQGGDRRPVSPEAKRRNTSGMPFTTTPRPSCESGCRWWRRRAQGARAMMATAMATVDMAMSGAGTRRMIRSISNKRAKVAKATTSPRSSGGAAHAPEATTLSLKCSGEGRPRARRCAS